VPLPCADSIPRCARYVILFSLSLAGRTGLFDNPAFGLTGYCSAKLILTPAAVTLSWPSWLVPAAWIVRAAPSRAPQTHGEIIAEHERMYRNFVRGVRAAIVLAFLVLLCLAMFLL
jgi:hypothetical protein